MGVRGKLFLTSLLLILASELAVEIYLEHVLRNWFDQRVASDLYRFARTAREAVRLAPSGTLAEMDALADRLGEATAKRVTIIARDGRVLGDSKLTVAEVAGIENHRDRPEVVAALAHGRGVARRFSSTLRVEMLYVALPFRHGAGEGGLEDGVVRVEVALEEVERTIARLRVFLVVAGVLGLTLAALISWIASHLLTRTLLLLSRHARAMAMGFPRQALTVREGDELSGLVGSFNALTQELDNTVANLALERTRLASVLEGMNDGVLALDEEGVIILVNWPARELLGLDGDPSGRLLEEVMPEAKGEEVCGSLSRKQMTSFQFERPGMPEVSLLVHVTPYRDMPGGVAVVHDVTESRRLDRLRQEFVADVSHELRTPVSAVLGYADTLLDETMVLPDDAHAMCLGMRRNALRIARLIDDLLDLARIDAKQHGLSPQSLALREEMEAVVRLHEQAVQQKSIVFSDDLPEDLSIEADGKGFARVMHNLIGNAVKYVPNGGRIHLRAMAWPGERVRIEVEDDGPGIPQEHRARIFDRFYRVDKGRSRSMGGTGLGLSIVRELVSAMGGEVGMEPVLPHGARFWVVFRQSSARSEAGLLARESE